MNTTSATLLERLRTPGEEAAWGRFVHLYSPLLYYWARRLRLQPNDAADLVQEVLTVLCRRLPEFSYDHDRSFRGWLRTVTLNTWRNSHRRRSLPLEQGSGILDEVPDPDGSDSFEENEYRKHLVGRALDLIRADFEPATWQAFHEFAVRGRPATEVAAELGINTGAVRAAKFRVLCRLRQELAGLLD